jgi:putative ABC transport system permease protein
MLERLIGLLLRLYPPGFRRRHGDAASRLAAEVAADGSVRRRLFVLCDLLLTLPRAWLRVVWLRLRFAGAACRDATGGVRRDVGFALRGLVRQPVHGAVVVVTLALAIGANAAVFTVTKALLLDRLPYDAPERVARVWGMAGMTRVNPLLAESPLVEGSALYFEDASGNLVEGSDASRVRATQVTAEFFRVLGVGMALGRDFSEEAEGGAWAVLSHGLWVRAFGRDPDVIGRPLRLSGRTFQIVGVAPARVDYPGRTEVWLSLPLIHELYGMAVGADALTRMRRGVTKELLERTLQRDARLDFAQEAEPPPEEYWLPVVHPLPDDLTKQVRVPLQVLTAGALLVLLLGCVNVAALTVARVVGRREELGVRRSLGATRAHLFGQLMLETMVPAVLGGTLSIVLARAGVPALRALLPPETAALDTVTPDVNLLLAVAAATLIAVVLAGLLPAVVASRGAGHRHDAGRTTDDRRRLHLGAVLATTQVALAVVLVVGAALLGRSLARLYAVPLGFDVDDVLTFEVRLPGESYADVSSRGAYLSRALERLDALPGVVAAGATSRLPLAEGLGVGFHVLVDGAAEESSRTASYARVSAGYFEAMGIPIVQGRTLAELAGAREIVLSEGLARALFPNGAAVGRVVRLPALEEFGRAVVAGVVADVRPRGPRTDAPPPMIYQSLIEVPEASIGFAVRAAGSPAALAPAVREAVREIDARVPAFALRTTGRAVAETLAANRAVAIVSGGFAACALLLAAFGIYGLMAQSVARRRRELGIRLAVGAQRRSLLWLVLRGGLIVALPGIAIGSAAALAAGRVVESLLFGIAATDRLTLLAVPLLIGAVALLAALLPARRAARTDPMESLRAQ